MYTNDSQNQPHYPPNNSQSIPQPTGLEAQFNALPSWGRWGLIGLSGSIFVGSLILLVVLMSSALGLPQPEAAAVSIQQPMHVSIIAPTPSSTPVPSPTPPSIHYPPTTVADLRGLAAKGDASAIHEFHRESVGLTGVCPQPKREVTVDPSVTGQQLAEDLLAYFYAQQLDTPCGSVVFAYHNQSESGDAYTAGRINVEVTDSSGSVNTDQNASGLKHKLTLNIGSNDSNQEDIVTY